MEMLKKEWNIKLRLKFCIACRRDFEDNELCVSALERRDNEWYRYDFCMNCWNSREEPHAFFCVWQGCFRKPDENPDETPLRRETAESLFRRLTETDMPEHMGVIYVLAVMLERGRILKEREVREIEGGWRVRVYEHRRGGEVFLITDPELRLEALDEVQQQVVHMLEPSTNNAENDSEEPPGEPEDGRA